MSEINIVKTKLKLLFFVRDDEMDDKTLEELEHMYKEKNQERKDTDDRDNLRLITGVIKQFPENHYFENSGAMWIYEKLMYQYLYCEYEGINKKKFDGLVATLPMYKNLLFKYYNKNK